VYDDQYQIKQKVLVMKKYADVVLHDLHGGRDEIYDVAHCLTQLAGNFYGTGNQYIGDLLDSYSTAIRDAAQQMVDAFDEHSQILLAAIDANMEEER
jgi:hypothetical protein